MTAKSEEPKHAWASEQETRKSPLEFLGGVGISMRLLLHRLKNEPIHDSVREGGMDKNLGINIEPFQRDSDWLDLKEHVEEPGWTEDELNNGFQAFGEVVYEAVQEVMPTFDDEIWRAVHGDETVLAEAIHGRLNENAYPWARMSSKKAWEKFGANIPVGELPIMMAKEGYGSYDSLLNAGAGKGCGMIVLVSDDQGLRTSWLNAIGIGLDKHWAGSIMGMVLSKTVYRPTIDPVRNRGILPLNGWNVEQSLNNFRSGKGYTSKRVLIAGDLGRVARTNPTMIGQIVAAGREGYASGNTGVVAMMSVRDFENWQHSNSRYWNKALQGAGIVTGGFLDMDAAERVARAYSAPFKMGRVQALGEKLMRLEKTQVAVLLGPNEVKEGWLLS